MPRNTKRIDRLWQILGEEELRVLEDNPGWDLHMRARRILAFQNDPQKAIECCQASIVLAEELVKPIGQGLADMNIGTILLRQGESRDAIIHYEKSLRIFEKTRNKLLQGLALMCLGVAELERYEEMAGCNRNRILAYLRTSEEFFKQAGNHLLAEVQDVLRDAIDIYMKSLGKRSTMIPGSAEEMIRQVLQPETLLPLFPIVGTVSAGQPIFADQNIEGYLDVAQVEIGGRAHTIHPLEAGAPVRLRPAARHFALRVDGDSMIDIGILDGDYVLVREQPKVEQGEIAAVQVQGLETEATLKRYRLDPDARRPSHIRLQPENSSMEPIVIPIEEAESVAVLGKAIAMFKKA